MKGVVPIEPPPGGRRDDPSGPPPRDPKGRFTARAVRVVDYDGTLNRLRRMRVLDQAVRGYYRSYWADGLSPRLLEHVPNCAACQSGFRTAFARLWAAEYGPPPKSACA